jgi:protein ImuB
MPTMADDSAGARLLSRCGTALLDALDRAIGAAPEVHECLVNHPLSTLGSNCLTGSNTSRRAFCRPSFDVADDRMARGEATGDRALRHFLEHERGRDAIAPTEIEVALGEPTR